MVFGTERTALLQPPLRGRLVEGAHVELVHDEQAAGLEQLGQPRERLLERVDVVERGDGQCRAERGGRLAQLEQRHGLNVRARRLRVDRQDLVPGLTESPCQLAAAGSDLEHADRRRGQVGANEGKEIGGDHGAVSSRM